MSTQELNERSLDALVAGVRDHIDLNIELPDEFFYASLPLCVIDAVFSIGVTYTSTRNTVARWCATHGWDRLRGSGSVQHSLGEFIDLCKSKAPVTLASEDFGNRQRTSSTGGILKAEAVVRFADVLVRHGVQRLGDTDDVDRNARIEAEIRTVPGQSSGISFEYFLMLAGSDQFVKADRMICRFVGEHIGLGRPATPADSRRLLTAAARRLGVAPRTLDYAVWNYQRTLVPA